MGQEESHVLAQRSSQPKFQQRGKKEESRITRNEYYQTLPHVGFVSIGDEDFQGIKQKIDSKESYEGRNGLVVPAILYV